MLTALTAVGRMDEAVALFLEGTDAGYFANLRRASLSGVLLWCAVLVGEPPAPTYGVFLA